MQTGGLIENRLHSHPETIAVVTILLRQEATVNRTNPVNHFYGVDNAAFHTHPPLRTNLFRIRHGYSGKEVSDDFDRRVWTDADTGKETQTIIHKDNLSQALFRSAKL